MLFAYSVAYGCDCTTMNQEESFRRAETVFMGKVVRIEPTGLRQKVTLEVKRVLKGESTNYVSLYQGRPSSCDYQFVQGGRYLVYANAYDGELSASICSSTTVFNYRGCGSGRLRTRNYMYLGGLSPSRFSYGEMALITAFCVSVSLSVGFFATRLWRRRKGQGNLDPEHFQKRGNEGWDKWEPF
jgi:hypothetical protein